MTILYNNGTHLRLFFERNGFSRGDSVSVDFAHNGGKITLIAGGTDRISTTGCIRTDVAVFMKNGYYSLYETSGGKGGSKLIFKYAKNLPGTEEGGKISLARREDNEEVYRGSERWGLRIDNKEEKEAEK